jgi:hypothetical protein
VESLYTLDNKSGHIVKNRKKRKDEEFELKMMKIDDRHKDYFCQENSLQNNPRNVPGSVIIQKNVPNNSSTSMHFSNRNMLLFLDNGSDDDSENDSDSDGRGQGGKDVKGVEGGIINVMNGQTVRAQPYVTSQRVDVRQRTGITDLMPLCVQLEIAVSQPLQEVRAAELYAAVNSLRHSHGLKSHLKCKYCTLSLIIISAFIHFHHTFFQSFFLSALDSLLDFFLTFSPSFLLSSFLPFSPSL